MSEPHALPDDLITLSAAGRLLHVAACTVYRWLTGGKLRAWRAGHRWKVSRREVEEMITVNAVRPEVRARVNRGAELAEVDRILREAGIRR